MIIKHSGRTPESKTAIQQLVDSIEKYGEVEEANEGVFIVDGRELMLVVFSSKAYFDRRGYHWFSLSRTRYERAVNWREGHAWLVLLCGGYGRYFVPFGEVKTLTTQIPPNRSDRGWDVYIRFEDQRAFLGIAKIQSQLDVTHQLHRFEQIWHSPEIEEEYADEAVYVPDSLPSPERKTGKAVRVVRDTAQSRIVKELYQYHCQICDLAIYAPQLKSKWYCEAHHVQPLGKQFRGPDHSSNIVALCPTHHCMMDLGVIAVDPLDLRIVTLTSSDMAGAFQLKLKREHGLNRKYLQFHFDEIYIGGLKIIELNLPSNDSW